MPMAVSPDRRFLYAVSRSLPCAIHVLAIDRAHRRADARRRRSPLAESLPYISPRQDRALPARCVVCGAVVSHPHGRGRDGRVALRASAGDPRGPQRAFDTRRRDQSIRLRSRRSAAMRSSCSRSTRMPGSSRSNTPARPADEPGGGTAPFRHLRRQQVPVPACGEMTAEIVTTFAIDAANRSADRRRASVSGLPPDNTLVPGAPRGADADAKPRPRHLGSRHPPDAGRQVPLPVGAHRKHAQRVRRRRRHRQGSPTGRLTPPSASRADSRSTRPADSSSPPAKNPTRSRSTRSTLRAARSSCAAGTRPGKGANWVADRPFRCRRLMATEDDWMGEALALARAAGARGEVPVGADRRQGQASSSAAAAMRRSPAPIRRRMRRSPRCATPAARSATTGFPAATCT